MTTVAGPLNYDADGSIQKMKNEPNPESEHTYAPHQ
jgi:hypothetical protein